MVNEIDEIFASSKPSGSSSGKPTAAASSATAGKSGKTSLIAKPVEPSSSSSKKKKRKRKALEAADASAKGVAVDEEEEWGGINLDDTSTKAPKAVEIVDASKPVRVDIPQPPRKKSKVSTSSSSKKSTKDDEDALFKDSRGTGPRKKTEEGYRVFKEDELGIDATAGDTPDCPFDCDCCF